MKYSYYISEDFFRDQLHAVLGHAAQVDYFILNPAAEVYNKKQCDHCDHMVAS